MHKFKIVAGEYEPIIPDAPASEIAHDCDAIHSEIIDIKVTPELYNRVYQEMADKLPKLYHMLVLIIIGQAGIS